MKTYITSVAGFQAKRQNKIQGFAKSLKDLKSFPRGPGANEAFWSLSHILHIFQFGQAITPSGPLSRAKPNSPLFLFICICRVQNWLLPPALQLFLERRDSLNEFRWLLVVQQPVQQNRNQNEIWGWRGEYITLRWSAGVYCMTLSRKHLKILTDVLANWTKTTTCRAQDKLWYISRRDKRGLMMGMMTEHYWISDAKGKSDGPFLLVFLPSQRFTTRHWTRCLLFLDRGPDSPLPREARRTLLDKLIPCI